MDLTELVSHTSCRYCVILCYLFIDIQIRFITVTNIACEITKNIVNKIVSVSC